MPLTDELGNSVRDTIGDGLPVLGAGTTFEDWLTLLSTPLPFLEGYANTARRASAQQVTAAIAGELEKRADDATQAPAPTWLLQLVALWHAERAVVITFNYDLLVERALTTLRAVVAFRGDSPPHSLRGSQVVYPSPNASVTPTMGDTAQPSGETFQLLKLHGSLNWFWAQGDGATLVREHDRAAFGQPVDRDRLDLSGTRTLDRFLIPPVTSKDSYYDINLVHMLWRSAYEAIKQASRLSILGYSMPPGDRIAGELIRQAGSDVAVDIVNYDVGNVEVQNSPLGRAAQLGLDVEHSWTGASSVADYARDRVASAAETAFSDLDFDEIATNSVVVSLPEVNGSGRYAALYAENRENPSVVQLPWPRVFSSEMPPNELALNELPRGTSSLDFFFDGDRLAAAGRPFELTDGTNRLVAIGAEIQRMERWTVVHLKTAPASLE